MVSCDRELREALAAVRRQFEVEAPYAFGSRAAEVAACIQGLGDLAIKL